MCLHFKIDTVLSGGQSWRPMAIQRFRDLLDPALYLSRVFGLFPLDSGFRRTKIYVLLAGFIFVALVLTVGEVIYMSLVRESERTERHRAILAFKMAILSLVPFAQLFRILLFVREVKAIVEILQKAEKILSKANISISYDYKQTYGIAVIRLVFELVYEVTNCLTSSISVAERVLRSCYFFAGMVLTQIIQLQLYCFLQALDAQIYSLQLLLVRIYILKELDILTVIEALNRLEIACTDLNRVYSLQLLLIVVFRYLSFLSSTYNVVMETTAYLTGSSSSTRFVGLFLDTCWLSYAILDIILLAKNCTTVISRVESINNSLYKLFLYSRQKEQLYSNKLKLHFVANRKIEFSACGLFLLDFSLVHSVLASTLTFLVIMMQMG
ncbi:Gustatory receptor 165 [Halyomorpha halys]|nr:Gustatory receptor 165 [Halyomorpha halys]